jgi:hypothetical protein
MNRRCSPFFYPQLRLAGQYSKAFVDKMRAMVYDGDRRARQAHP